MPRILAPRTRTGTRARTVRAIPLRRLLRQVLVGTALGGVLAAAAWVVLLAAGLGLIGLAISGLVLVSSIVACSAVAVHRWRAYAVVITGTDLIVRRHGRDLARWSHRDHEVTTSHTPQVSWLTAHTPSGHMASQTVGDFEPGQLRRVLELVDERAP